MANVKVAVRVRPPSKKEVDAGATSIVDVNADVLSITNLKIHSSEGDRNRERVKNYSFDHCYNSVDRHSDNYASQELIYQELGTEVLNASFGGYNACLFAYGQTGSGKTYTMMGDEVDIGLIPRICEGMCSRVDDLEHGVTFKIEVSYLEIYNERVRDLLALSNTTKYTLKVREHPKDGPYVQDLTKHMVSDFNSVMMLVAQGNRNRTTAETHMHEASSRSHAIFTLNFVQAKMVNNLPSEIVSKINLVDLAGSERANLNYSKGRLQEGANINKSLVTLGNCISALGMPEEDDDAESSMMLSAASLESLAMSEDGEVSSPKRRPGFIPYRNSVLTWLLKDSLGGNSRTIMIATISPSSIYFNETMSTLRYARRAKRIINQPFINEDPNVRLIRDLRAEINRLRVLLQSASLSSSQASLVQDVTLSKMLAENEQKVDQLTEAWVDKWREAARIMQECNVGIRRESMGVIVESELPHLICMDDDLLSTGIILYHLMEGKTAIGREDAEKEQDIVLWGPGVECQHAVIVNQSGKVTLHPVGPAACAVNGNDVHEPTPLSQGAVILLGKTNMFRFNNPAEAARLREKRASSIKPTDVEEIRRPRKNSVTLRVHNNITAVMEEGSRLHTLSLSRECPPESRDSPTVRGRSLDTAPEVSAIMMYNPGLELERQHKIKADKVESTRKRLKELEDKERVVEAAHKKEEERMKVAYEEQQRMIQEQQDLLERLREEHEKVKKDTEQDLEEMRETLKREKEEGQKQLEEECQSLRKDQTRKASVSAALSPVICQETEETTDLSLLDVDRKRLTQMELVQRQSQRKAEAVLERRQAAFERQRSASLRLIEQEERRLHEIECLPSFSDRYASASNDSLDSSLKWEDDTNNGVNGKDDEIRDMIGWGRVSPIGGRSDTDSASSKAASNSSDKEDGTPRTTQTVCPPQNKTSSQESLPHRTTKSSQSKNVNTPSVPSKTQVRTPQPKAKPNSNSVFSRLYQKPAPKFDFLHRKQQQAYLDGQTSGERTKQDVKDPQRRQRSLTDGAQNVSARRNQSNGQLAHSKPQKADGTLPLSRSPSRDSKSKLRTKSVSPRLAGDKFLHNSKNLSITPAMRKQDVVKKENGSPSTSRAESKSPVKPQTQRKRDSQSPSKNPPSKTKTDTKLSAKDQPKTSSEQTRRPRRTKTPSSESAIEKSKRRKPENVKDQKKKEKHLPKSLPNIMKPIAKAVEKLKSKSTENAVSFFVGVGDETENVQTEPFHQTKDSKEVIPLDVGSILQEHEQGPLIERQPAIGCSEPSEDLVTIPAAVLDIDVTSPDSFSRELEEILSDSDESYPDSLEGCRPDSLEDDSSLKDEELPQRRRKQGFSVDKKNLDDNRLEMDILLKPELQLNLLNTCGDNVAKHNSDSEIGTSDILAKEDPSTVTPYKYMQTPSGYVSDHSNEKDVDNCRDDQVVPVELHPDQFTANENNHVKEIKSRPVEDTASSCASMELTVCDSGVSTDDNSVSSDQPLNGSILDTRPTVLTPDLDKNFDVWLQQEMNDDNSQTPVEFIDNNKTNSRKERTRSCQTTPVEIGLDEVTSFEAPLSEHVTTTPSPSENNVREQQQKEYAVISAGSDSNIQTDVEVPETLHPLNIEQSDVDAKTLKTDPLPDLEMEYAPRTIPLTEHKSQTAKKDIESKQDNNNSTAVKFPEESVADELNAEKLFPVRVKSSGLDKSNCSSNPAMTMEEAQPKDIAPCDQKAFIAKDAPPVRSTVWQKTKRASRKPDVLKEHSPPAKKSGKKPKKRRTPVKFKKDKRPQNFSKAPSGGDFENAISIYPLRESKDEVVEPRGQTSPFSSSLSSSSATGDFSCSESLHSRSPDDEVALISDGVSDPPDLSDKPATPTDLILKPLPSPKELVESVFWGSLSNTSDSNEDDNEGIFIDGGESLIEPLEILENEFGQSSELSLFEDDEEAGDEHMAESGNLTFKEISNDQLDETLQMNQTATMQNSAELLGITPRDSFEGKSKEGSSPIQMVESNVPISNVEIVPKRDSLAEDVNHFIKQNENKDDDSGLVFASDSNEVDKKGSKMPSLACNSKKANEIESEPELHPHTLSSTVEDGEPCTSQHKAEIIKKGLISTGPLEVASLEAVTLPLTSMQTHLPEEREEKQVDRTSSSINSGCSHLSQEAVLQITSPPTCHSDIPLDGSLFSKGIKKSESPVSYNATTWQSPDDSIDSSLHAQTLLTTPNGTDDSKPNKDSQLPFKILKDSEVSNLEKPNLQDAQVVSDVIEITAENPETIQAVQPEIFSDHSLGCPIVMDMLVPETSLTGENVFNAEAPGVSIKTNTLEPREDMVPDGAIVESKADETQNLVLKRGQIATEVNTPLMQEELLKLRILLNAFIVKPSALEIEDLYQKSELEKNSPPSKKNSPRFRETLRERSLNSDSPDSSTEELTIIEQLRCLSEKLGSSLPGQDTPLIIERARSLSNHLEKAHSSVYSPSLLEELKELSSQLDATHFLTIEQFDERVLSLDQINQGSDEDTGSFQSAQDLTLYQTALEIRQECIQPTPLNSLLIPSAATRQSTPFRVDIDLLEQSHTKVMSPLVSPLLFQSIDDQPDELDAVFHEKLHSGKSTPDLDEVESESDDQKSPVDDAMDTAERVMSEMTSFKMQLDMLSGSDAADDDDVDDDIDYDYFIDNESSSDDSDEDTYKNHENKNDTSPKNRQSLSSRSSMECMLPTISEECLSSSDVDEPEVKVTIKSPPEKTKLDIFLEANEPFDENTDLDQAVESLHTDSIISHTADVNLNSELSDEPPVSLAKLRTATVQNLPEEEQRWVESLHTSPQEVHLAQSQHLQTDSASVAEPLQPLTGKEYTATKAKLNMLVRILGGNWESFGETSSEGSGPSSPVNSEPFLLMPSKDQIQDAHDEVDVGSESDKLVEYYSEEESSGIITYDESTQTDLLTEEDIDSLVEISEISSGTDSHGALPTSLTGGSLANTVTQTALTYKNSSLKRPACTSEAVTLPKGQLSSDEDDDNQKATFSPSSSYRPKLPESQLVFPQLLSSITLDNDFLRTKLSLENLPEIFEDHTDRVTEERSKVDDESMLLPLTMLQTETIVNRTAVILNQEDVDFPSNLAEISVIPAVDGLGVDDIVVQSSPTYKQSNVEQDLYSESHVVDPVISEVAMLLPVIEIVQKTAKVLSDEPINLSILEKTDEVQPHINNENENEEREESETVVPLAHLIEPCHGADRLSPSTEGELLVIQNGDTVKSFVDSVACPDQTSLPSDIPEICLLEPHEDHLTKTAALHNDKPITWPALKENLSSNPSRTSSLFQPIREESNSASSNPNPSAEKLLDPDESAKAPEHGQTLQVIGEHAAGDTSLSDLKQLSTVMGLSPQRSYSTDEELIQIFSKGVAHFRSLKQDAVKPRLVTASTNTSPVEAIVDQQACKVDAAVMTDVASEKANAYTSMSPDIEQEPHVDEVDTVRECITPLAQLTASQLLTKIVETTPKQSKAQQTSNVTFMEEDEPIFHQQKDTQTNNNISNAGSSINDKTDSTVSRQNAISPKLHPEETVVSVRLTDNKGDQSDSTEINDYPNKQSQKAETLPASRGIQRLGKSDVNATPSQPESQLKNPTVISPVHPDSTNKPQENESCLEFDDEEKILLEELRRRTLKSQQAAKRAMDCALRLRQRNQSEKSDGLGHSPKELSVTPQFNENRLIITQGEDASQADPVQTGSASSDSENDRNAFPETLQFVNELVNKECTYNMESQEFASKVSQLVQDTKDNQGSPSRRKTSYVNIILQQPSPIPNFDETSSYDTIESPRLSPSSQTVKEEVADMKSSDQSPLSESFVPSVFESIQREAICCADSDPLAFRFAKLQDESTSKVKINNFKAQQDLAQQENDKLQGQLPSMSVLVGHRSKSFAGPENSMRTDWQAFEKPSPSVRTVHEILSPTELVLKEKKHLGPISDEIKNTLSKMEEESESEINMAEETEKNEETNCGENTDKEARQEEHDNVKHERPLFPTFSDISFDLENSDDEDLQALKKTNENIDRVIAETSSIESDFEDDTEPELAALVDDEIDSFILPGSSADEVPSSGSISKEPPKAISAPASCIPAAVEVDDQVEVEEDMDEPNEQMSCFCLRGILISPDKLEGLLADSESGSSSTSSSPKETEDSQKELEESEMKSNGMIPVDDEGLEAVGEKVSINKHPESMLSSLQNNTAKQQVQSTNTYPNSESSLADPKQPDNSNQCRPFEKFHYEPPTTKQGIFLPDSKVSFEPVTEVQDPFLPDSMENDILSKPQHYTWPLSFGNKPLEADLSEKPGESLARLKNLGNGIPGGWEQSIDVQAYPIINYEEVIKEQKLVDEDIIDASKEGAEMLNQSLTQSSGIFSASPRENQEFSFIEDRGNGAEKDDAVCSETDEADLSRVHQEYRNILEDSHESETQTTPTNVFTQTDEKTASPSSTINDDSGERDESPEEAQRLGASWPLRESIRGINTRVGDRRDIAVELMEASLMHGMGETDAFLKFLDGDLPIEQWKSPETTMRHRRSRSHGEPLLNDLDASRHEPSPSKHKPRKVTNITPSPSVKESESVLPTLPVRSSPEIPSSTTPSPTCRPSERRKFLQHLRGTIISATSTQRPERAKIDALLQDSWLGTDSTRLVTPGSKEKAQLPKDTTKPKTDDIEALLEESRLMREKSRAEIAKAEQNLSYQRPRSRFDPKEGRNIPSAPQRASTSPRDTSSPAGCANPLGDPAMSLGARPKSVDALLKDRQRLRGVGGKEYTNGHHGNPEDTSRYGRPHSAHGSLDMYNCTDAIEREIQCLRAASAAMSSHPLTTSSPDLPTWRGSRSLPHTPCYTPPPVQPPTHPSPPQPQRYLASYDRASPSYHSTPPRRDESFHPDSPKQSQGTTSSYGRLPHPHTLIIPVIALHPPSPEELDPTSIPVIARANKVLQASYRSHDDPSSTEVPDRSTQGRVDSPSAARSKDASPRRSGRSSRRGSGERRTPELPPIIETPLVTLDTLYHLVADQAMEFVIREMTLTGRINLNKSKQPNDFNGWRYQGKENNILLWQKNNRCCPYNSFLGLSLIKAPASSVFNLLSTTSDYSCLHKAIKNVKLLHRINSTLKVVHITCDMDHCSLHKQRDFCCVIKHTQQHGKWFIVVSSVQHPMCPSGQSAVRGQILCCGISMEPVSTADGEHCRVSYLSQIDLKGDLKPTLVNHLTSRLPLCIAHLRDCIEIGHL
ncbi:microtubule-associated protein futsch-like [Asterias rubens]|uniref:microtubule-associated protein futsch-like n=1 Tax=Asterias rubens TaxID=7604 RepID=UPI0014556156|nr:microtubule-associated protein futsch-like [Asterias rubens]